MLTEKIIGAAIQVLRRWVIRFTTEAVRMMRNLENQIKILSLSHPFSLSSLALW